MKSLKKNFAYNLIYEILKLLIPFITIPYVSRTIGADGIGVYSFTYSIVTYYLIAARFGTDIFGRREISYYRDDVTERSRVFWEVFLFRLFSSVLCLGVYLVHVFLFTEVNRGIYLILVMVLIDNIADVTWFYQGLEEFGFVVRRNLIIKLLGLAYIFLFVKSPDDLSIYVFGLMLCQLLGNMALWLRIPKDVVRVNFAKLHVFGHFGEMLSLFLPGIAMSIYTVFDKTMIGLICEGSAENGYYEQAYKTVLIILTIVKTLGTVGNPRISYYYGRGETDRIRELMMKSYRGVCLISIPMCLGLIGISESFVPWFYGPGFESVVGLLNISAFIIVAVGISNITGIQYMVPTKKQGVFTGSILVGAGVNFVLNLFFIKPWGAVGAMIASVISESVIALVQLYIVRKEFSFVRIVAGSVKYWIAGLVMLLVVKLEGMCLPASVVPTWSGTAVMILSGGLVYFAVLFILRDSLCVDYGRLALQHFRNGVRPH